MKKRVYGIIVIGTKMANWNADFTGYAKRTANSKIYASDKSLKYSFKKKWQSEGEKVIFFKKQKESKGDITYMSNADSYEDAFKIKLDASNKKEILEKLFNAVDIANFGASFLVKNGSINITGAAQIGQGFNIYEGANDEVLKILSPFPSEEGKEQTSIGDLKLLDEAHYVYPFSINPSNYKGIEELLGVEELYTDEMYQKFKEGATQGATALTSVTKAGCYNELSLFVEMKEGSKIYLEPMDNLVEFRKEGDKAIYSFEKISKRLKEIKKEVHSATIYYNKYQVELEGTDGIELKDIFEMES